MAAMTNDHLVGAYTLNAISALASTILPILGVISFAITIAWTIYQWRKDVQKNN